VGGSRSTVAYFLLPVIGKGYGHVMSCLPDPISFHFSVYLYLRRAPGRLNVINYWYSSRLVHCTQLQTVIKLTLTTFDQNFGNRAVAVADV